MTIKYICDLCGEEIEGEEKLYTLTLEMPDFEPETLAHYCPKCSDIVTAKIKELKPRPGTT